MNNNHENSQIIINDSQTLSPQELDDEQFYDAISFNPMNEVSNVKVKGAEVDLKKMTFSESTSKMSA